MKYTLEHMCIGCRWLNVRVFSTICMFNVLNNVSEGKARHLCLHLWKQNNIYILWIWTHGFERFIFFFLFASIVYQLCTLRLPCVRFVFSFDKYGFSFLWIMYGFCSRRELRALCRWTMTMVNRNRENIPQCLCISNFYSITQQVGLHNKHKNNSKNIINV